MTNRPGHGRHPGGIAADHPRVAGALLERGDRGPAAQRLADRGPGADAHRGGPARTRTSRGDHRQARTAPLCRPGSRGLPRAPGNRQATDRPAHRDLHALGPQSPIEPDNLPPGPDERVAADIEAAAARAVRRSAITIALDAYRRAQPGHCQPWPAVDRSRVRLRYRPSRPRQQEGPAFNCR